MSKAPSNPFTLRMCEPQELELPSGRIVAIPKCNYIFDLWRGKRPTDTYKTKPVLDFDGEAVFAELAILRILQESGWDGVWVDTYSHGKFRKSFDPHCCDLPSHAQKLYDRIRKLNSGKIGGCFDVFAWKRGRYLFVESKRHSKDSIRETQKRWVEAALNAHLPLHSLLICEWSLKK